MAGPDPRRETRLRSDGDHVAHTWNDAVAGPGVLALHGFTGCGEDWAPIAEALRIPLVTPDLVGHGDTVAPAHVEAYRIERVIDDCLAWCEGRERWVVVGYSMGGRVAMRLAQHLGDRLEGLVLISASPGIEDPGARAERAVQDRQLADAIEREGVAWFAERWANHPLIRTQQQIPAAILAAMTARRLRNRAQGLAGSLRGMGQGAVEPTWSTLSTIQAPTLLLSGALDPTYTALAERCATLLPRARHVNVAGAGHCTHLEALAPSLAALGAFFDARGVSSARGTG